MLHLCQGMFADLQVSRYFFIIETESFLVDVELFSIRQIQEHSFQLLASEQFTLRVLMIQCEREIMQ